MKKVTIIGHRFDREKAVEVLQNVASLQIEDLTEVRDDEPAQRAGPVELKALSEVTHCIEFLDRFQQQQKGLLDAFIGSKLPITPEERSRILGEFDWHEVYSRCVSIDTRIAEMRNLSARLKTQQESLLPWAELDAPTEDIKDTETTEVYLARTSTPEMDALEEKTKNERIPIALRRISNAGNTAYAVVLVRKADKDAAEALRPFALERVSLAEFSGSVRLNLAKTEAEMARLAKEEASIEAEVAELLKHYDELLLLYDEFSSLRSRNDAQNRFINTRETFFIRGWVREKRMDELKTALDDATDSSLVVSFEDPGPGDNPPVYLENSKWIEPFEMVTTIYGYPAYDEVDPTPLLAPFFFTFFGIALSDAAYGVVLSLVCLWAIKNLDTPFEEKKLFRLLAICGVSTLIFGAMMGGWFGDLYVIPYFAFMKPFRDMFLVLDPIANPLGMLMVSLALGFIQIWYGIYVKMRANIRENGLIAGVLDEGSWLFLLGAIVVFLLGNVSEALKPLASVGMNLIKAGALFVVIGSGRNAKGWLAKPFVGLYGLYGIIGYFSDMLSYARLLALGLATGVIASVVNQMALLMKPIPFLGPVVMVAVLLGGHLANLMINILGSFIHSGRLQFVEFFTKFFEGGGKAFKPFRKENKYTAVRDQA